MPMKEQATPAIYEIRLQGMLGSGALTAFPTLTARADDRETVLSGHLPDQAALFGVLDQVESLGLELLSLQRVS
jgi:hypothetical protein